MVTCVCVLCTLSALSSCINYMLHIILFWGLCWYGKRKLFTSIAKIHTHFSYIDYYKLMEQHKYILYLFLNLHGLQFVDLKLYRPKKLDLRCSKPNWTTSPAQLFVLAVCSANVKHMQCLLAWFVVPLLPD
jgi:hypothetical protein